MASLPEQWKHESQIQDSWKPRTLFSLEMIMLVSIFSLPPGTLRGHGIRQILPLQLCQEAPLQPDSISLERQVKQQPLFRDASPGHILFLRAPPSVFSDSLSSLCLLQKDIYLLILPQGRCLRVNATSARALPCLKGEGGIICSARRLVSWRRELGSSRTSSSLQGSSGKFPESS